MAKKVYDIFISHDFEDKSAIADELNVKLREAGFKVWYSGADLKAGDDMEDVILNSVIPQSLYTVAIISNNYIKSIWTRKEFNAAASLEIKRRKVIIPVLFDISFDEVAVIFPLQQMRFAIQAGNDFDKTVRQLVKACKVNPAKQKSIKSQTDKLATNINNAGAIALGGNINISGDNAAGRDILTNPKQKK